MRLFSDVSQFIRDPWLRYAFHLAERGRGTTHPNPLVGCVVVADEVVVGEGFHARAGEPHAEAVALADAGERARGATVYVTLEPCDHYGRTPPCTDAIIEAGVGHVVIGMRDPNPGVSGGGAEKLREAGVEVTFAEDATPFAEQNEAWLVWLEKGRPFIRVKVALSLDGHPAFEESHRAAITGAAGAEVTRVLRARSDAVLVGSATVAADDPALTVRDSDGRLADRQPLRVVLARTNVPPFASRVLSDDAAPSIVLLADDAPVDADALVGRGLDVRVFRSEDGLHGALRTLGELPVLDLLVEPGPRLLTSLWVEDLIDELTLVTAGGMAGNDALPLFLGGPERIGDRLVHSTRALEAGVVGDVAVSVWQRVIREVESDV